MNGDLGRRNRAELHVQHSRCGLRAPAFPSSTNPGPTSKASDAIASCLGRPLDASVPVAFVSPFDALWLALLFLFLITNSSGFTMCVC